MSDSGNIDQYGECDMTDCDRPATEAIIGDAGDLWLCHEHDAEGRAFRNTLGITPSENTE